MKIKVEPGKYVVAVSGGVDSMVLLDLLCRQDDIELIVAHFDHGIRADSGKDRKLVGSVAKKHKLIFKTASGHLGNGASEEQARNARYLFLNKVKDSCGTRAIITAHHQDDLIETAILNLLRGSGRLGLSSMLNSKEILHPLISFSKQDILAYAKKAGITWREDSSNVDTKYLRNYVRINIIPKLTDVKKQELLNNAERVAEKMQETETLIATLSQSISSYGEIDRSKYLVVPSPLDKELIAYWLRREGIRDFDRKTIERLCLGLKTARANTRLDIAKGLNLEIGTTVAHFSNR